MNSRRNDIPPPAGHRVAEMVSCRTDLRWLGALLAYACCLGASSLATSVSADESVIRIINQKPSQRSATTSRSRMVGARAEHKARAKKTSRTKDAPATAKRSLPALLDSSLLVGPIEPDCGFKGSMNTPPTPEETRMKLDYEAQCYRQAEGIVRSRL